MRLVQVCCSCAYLDYVCQLLYMLACLEGYACCLTCSQLALVYVLLEGS